LLAAAVPRFPRALVVVGNAFTSIHFVDVVVAWLDPRVRRAVSRP
jgi:ABC-type dipeptide/oligopeptide/nickel transport system permease component